DGNRDRLAASLQANGDLRKPVQIRRGPATVTGSCSGSTPLGAYPGRRAARPEPGDVFVRATCRSLAGGMVALRTRGAVASTCPLRRALVFSLCAAGHIAPTSRASC